jgi:hypothetical protein
MKLGIWMDRLVEGLKEQLSIKAVDQTQDIHSHTNIMQIPVKSLGTIVSLLFSVRNSQY